MFLQNTITKICNSCQSLLYAPFSSFLNWKFNLKVRWGRYYKKYDGLASQQIERWILDVLWPNAFYTYILNIEFLNTFYRQHFLMSQVSFFPLQLNGFIYFYLIQIILFTINHLFVQNLMFSSIPMYLKQLNSHLLTHN